MSPMCRWLGASLCCLFFVHASFGQQQRPNVIVVITDDQGYGDLACHGNPVIKTPNLDKLHSQSIRLTNFHVDPTCAPTRAALMTGRYSTKTGVWHTIMGRSILAADEVTLADIFSANGYKTGIFGKWHLGDNYPFRPQDRGFQVSLVHGGGGVGQTPDFWGNDYFDDTYWLNGVPTKFTGYCTDVFFDQAIKFIEDHRSSPFLLYLSTNAPHSPYLVAEKYSAPYREQGVPHPRDKFWGMITNIDENLGKLVEKLKRLGIEENTILLFMTDNGTAAGFRPAGKDKGGFNAGRRGTKGSPYEGGHRVPCFWRWPGKFNARDISTLTAHFDILPTLMDLCDLKSPRPLDLDGISLAPALTQGQPIPERTLFVHSQRIDFPEKWRQCSVMTERWRLVNGSELYDIIADPGQQRDISAEHPDVVTKLRAEYERWYEEISGRFDEYVRPVLGASQAPVTELTAHDWHADEPSIPWNQGKIQDDDLFANGVWKVEVVREGKLRFILRQRPEIAKFPIQAQTARIRIGDHDERKAIPTGASEVHFDLLLQPGKYDLQTWLESEGRSRGAYYVEVRTLE